MGIDPKSLGPRAQQLIRDADAKRRAGVGGGTPLPPPADREPETRPVFLELAMSPPTATHHDKQIAPVARKGGGFRMTLRNSKALQAAQTMYLGHIKPNTRPPIDGPVDVTICFAWAVENPGDPPSWYQDKPDWDNSAKLLCDVLAERGYLVDDKRIVHGEAFKIRWPRPFVTVFIAPATPGALQRVLAMIPGSQRAVATELLRA